MPRATKAPSKGSVPGKAGSVRKAVSPRKKKQLVPSSGRQSEDSARTRTAILDATEQIICEEGHAAVSSRRVASAAGLKSQLVHYYFKTMDDLLLAVLYRAEELYFKRQATALASNQPLRGLWEFSLNHSRTKLVIELMALATLRPVIREEIARSGERLRMLQTTVLARVLAELGIGPEVCPPVLLSLAIAGVSRAIVMETQLGVHEGHTEMLAFVEQRIQQVEAAQAATAAKREKPLDLRAIPRY